MAHAQKLDLVLLRLKCDGTCAETRFRLTAFKMWWHMRRNQVLSYCVWNVMAHGDAPEEKWRGDWRMDCVASKRHMTAEHRLARAVKTLQAEVYSSPASSRVKWFPRWFKWTRPLRRKTKSGFWVRVITFQTH